MSASSAKTRPSDALLLVVTPTVWVTVVPAKAEILNAAVWLQSAMKTVSLTEKPAVLNNGIAAVAEAIGPERVAGMPTGTLTTRTSEPATGAGAAPVIAGGSAGVQPGPVY